MYAADNMDPAVKQEMEYTYKDHYKSRARDWITQITAFQDLMKHAIPTEKKCRVSARSLQYRHLHLSYARYTWF